MSKSVKIQDLIPDDKNYTFIYALACPDSGLIRYIGKSNNPNARYSRHLSNSRDKKYHVCNWITSLIKEGKKPALLIKEICEVPNWKVRETYWINYYKSIGVDLTNSKGGGDGLDFISEETRKRMSLKKIGNKNNSKFVYTDEHKQKMSIAAKNKFKSAIGEKLIQGIRENQKKAAEKNRGLTEGQVKEIKRLLAAGMPQSKVSELTKVNAPVIHKIKACKNYAWVKI